MGLTLSRNYSVLAIAGHEPAKIAFFATAEECARYARKLWGEEWAQQAQIIDEATGADVSASAEGEA